MAGCPHCGDADSQVMDLLKAWKEIEELKDLLKKRPERVATMHIPDSADVTLSLLREARKAEIVNPHVCETEWKQKYDAIKEAYIKTRLEVSGSFGNWSGDTRRRVLEHEISSELGFDI